MTTHAEPSRRPPREAARRRRRRAAAILGAVPAAALTLAWVATRSWFLSLVAEAVLEPRLGGDLEIGRATYAGGGTLVLEDMRLVSRQHRGPAAQALRVARTVATIDPSRLLRGALHLDSLELNGVLLRLSEDARQPGVFNIQGLRPDWSIDRSGDPLLPPSVRINGATIEMGLHIGRHYRAVGQRVFEGRMQPAPDGGGWYDFALQERLDGAPPGAQPVTMKGRWNVETLEHTARLEGLVLDDRTLGMCPQIARLWWEQMQPQGPVGTAVLQWRQGGPPTATLSVEQVALNIPIAADALFPGRESKGARLPRMHVNSGVVRLEGDRLSLERFVGAFRDSTDDSGGMPFRLDLRIDQLPSFSWQNPQQWMEKVIEAAPFEMNVRVRDFRLAQSGSDSTGLIELPSPITVTIKKFNLVDWTLGTDVRISRATPRVLADESLAPSSVLTSGRATITDASGAFQGFPYALDDVTAQIEFDNERVVLNELRARGSGGARISISGTISPPDRTAAVALRLDARDVPLDERFQGALRGAYAETFDRALHRPSYERLVDLDLIPGAAAMDEAARSRQALAARLDSSPAGTEAEALGSEIRRLDRVIEAGPFELGGEVDLSFTIEREGGEDRPTHVSGDVNVHRAGVVYERFPYPIQVLGGQLRVSPQRIEVVSGPGGEGLPVATTGGGRGTISGAVTLNGDRDGPAVVPAVSFRLEGDLLGELLYQAMPIDRPVQEAAAAAPATPEPADAVTRPQGDPARPALLRRVLSGAGLSGRLDLSGEILAGEDGAPTYRITADVSEGTADPRPELFEALRELGLPAPQGLRLDDLRARIHITPGAIELEDFRGSQGEASMAARGRIALHSDPLEASIAVDFRSLALERYMIELTPGAAEKTAALWDRYQPQGTYDAELLFEAGASGRSIPQLRLRPRSVEVLAAGERVRIDCERGELSFQSNQVRFDDFLFGVRCGDRDEGHVVLDGSYGLTGATEDLELRGEWEGGELASPIILEALRLIGAERQAERYRRLEPRGRFDAQFEYLSPRGGRNRDYTFAIRPATVRLTISGTPIEARLQAGAELSFTPGRIVLREIAGEHEGGRFYVDGKVDLGASADVSLDVGYLGAIDSPQLLAILPEAARSAIRSIELTATEPVHLKDAWVRVTQAEATSESGWETAFGGLVVTRGAALRVGSLRFEDLDGTFRILAEGEPQRPPTLEIEGHAARARMLGRPITNMQTSLRLGEEGYLYIPELRAEAYGGVLSGAARIGLAKGAPYEARIDVAGVSLDAFAADGSGDAAAAPDDGPRGETYGSLRVYGSAGVPESRRGRGAIRVAWGRMASMPVTLRLLQLMELMPPLSGNLDFADVEMYVLGDRVVFEKLLLECPTLQMVGQGEMSYPGMDLSVRLRSRGTIPLVHDLIAGISDQLFEVEITGPLSDPRARLVPLPAMDPGPHGVGSPPAPAAAQGG